VAGIQIGKEAVRLLLIHLFEVGHPLLVLLVLNKTNNLLKQQEDASRKAKAAFAGVLGRALPSNHETISLKSPGNGLKCCSQGVLLRLL
jgi:hypothetical protein